MSAKAQKQNAPAPSTNEAHPFPEPVQKALEIIEGKTAEDLLPYAMAWCILHYKGAPWRLVDPHFGLDYPESWEDARHVSIQEHTKANTGKPRQWSEFNCRFTGRKFRIPTGAPVPSLFYRVIDEQGKDITRDLAHDHFTAAWISPHIAVHGEENVVEHLQEYVAHLLEEATQNMTEAMQYQSFLDAAELRGGLPIRWPEYWLSSKAKKERAFQIEEAAFVPELHNVRMD